MELIIINGPNLNLVGDREQHIYGASNFEELLEELKKSFPDLVLHYYQSNVEGEIIDKLQDIGFSYDGIILNAGGYTHTSVAIADAVRAITSPVAEVHISNIFAREDYRHVSLIAPHAVGTITGFGMTSYRLAVESFMMRNQ